MKSFVGKLVNPFLLTLLAVITAVGQSNQKPIIRTQRNSMFMYMNKERGNFNGINDLPKDFSYDFGTETERTPLTLVSEQDSVVLLLRHGVQTDFQIIRQAKGDTVQCHFSSHPFVKAAVFTDAYKKANQGKTIIEVPEVYELINVVFALTDYGKTEAIYKGTDYYSAVMTQFMPYKTNRAVQVIDSLLRASADQYHNLKMDSYAFQFQGDRLVNGGIYDRVSWGEQNTLSPYIPLLEQFAKESKFRVFYQKNQPYYNSLITDFRQNVNVACMKDWLEKQFPTTRYSAVKVLFSPLVGWNQSANNFSDNDFTEAQAHVDFPFVSATQKSQPPTITKGQRMKIVFTELNHNYLNPEAEKYTPQIGAAFKDLSKWITNGKPSAGYSNALSCFEEYMNYALVSLLYADLFDAKSFDTLNAGVEKGMVVNRGFQRFKEFNEELLRLYRTRKPGQTVADLYPAIISWAAAQP
ncbi:MULTISPECIES: DUF4932 domain-containing protein [unclassified Spirosoma]|uniref:DUF4932 domain-containing protein n=1 Tax=unclassified Spirosoma TaxID=2621999 RepID=UPI0025FA0C8B|nr:MULTISPECIES: DUF4932 domain-containing protein [unclassified Spirosoma]